jgi:hypothetical protein
LDTDGWELESGVERHRETPATFQIPEETVRSRLVPESDAKLIFRMRTSGGEVVVERMWVHVTGYTEDGYAGVLNTEPKTDGVPLSLGDRVTFQPDHVIDALPPANWNPDTGEYEA